jgi:nodulation protein E
VRRDGVVISGMGAVSAAGLGADALWTAARDGRSAVSTVELPRGERLNVRIAAQIKAFDPAAHLEAEVLPGCDRYSQFALVAADQAVAQAGLQRGTPLGERTAVIVGTGIGGWTTIDDMNVAYYLNNARFDPLTIPRGMANAAACLISMRYGATGPTFCVSSACSSATQAIGIGAAMVRSGAVDRAIVGGSEACLTATAIRAWELLRVLTPNCCRPFSKGRNGMVLGEGAGIFVLETMDGASARGASPLAEIAGYGTSSDATDLVRPDANGAAAAMRGALKDAEVGPESIGYVNAHGTGTILNDIVETAALRQVFGEGLSNIAVSSTKPIHGHALGAAGALELAITVMAVREGVAPPTINWLEPDGRCLPDPVATGARSIPIEVALSNSFAFGGINASLAVRQVH